VRLGLGDADLAGDPLEVDGDQVDGALQVGDHMPRSYSTIWE